MLRFKTKSLRGIATETHLQAHYMQNLHQLLEATLVTDTNIVKQVSHQPGMIRALILINFRPRLSSTPSSTRRHNVFPPYMRFRPPAKIKA